MTIQEQITKLEASIKHLQASLLALAAKDATREDLEVAYETIALIKNHRRRLARLVPMPGMGVR